MSNNLQNLKIELGNNLKKEEELELALKYLINRNFLSIRYRALQESLQETKGYITTLIGKIKIQNCLLKQQKIPIMRH